MKTNTENKITNNMILAGKDLDLMGTPAFIIMPTYGANTSNTTIVPGFASKASLQQAIDKAIEKAKKSKSLQIEDYLKTN